MSPSRGPLSSSPAAKTTPFKPSDDEALIDRNSTSALRRAQSTFRYLYSPSDATADNRPNRHRTRALLLTLRYIGIFVFWRAVRYAKYVAIASLVATVGATAFGGLVSGVGFVVAPTGIAGTIFAASVWGVGKWGARRLERRWKRGREQGGGYKEIDAEIEGRRTPQMRSMVGSEALPW